MIGADCKAVRGEVFDVKAPLGKLLKLDTCTAHQGERAGYMGAISMATDVAARPGAHVYYKCLGSAGALEA